jgi:hypothetical protein
MRTLLIAVNDADADAWRASKSERVRRSLVVVVTPNSLDRARGVTATHIAWTPQAVEMPHALKKAILDVVTPCFATMRPEKAPDVGMFADQLGARSAFRRGNV